MARKCEICGERPAAFVLREITGSSSERRYLCQPCAEERGVGVEAGVEGTGSGLAKPSSMTAHTFMRRLEQGVGRQRQRCPGCGSVYAEIRRRGLFGCALCYDTFEVEVGELLRRIHGEGRHRGKGPQGEGNAETSKGVEAAEVPEAMQVVALPEDGLSSLRKELAAAIAREDFETAARLRDRIREIEGAQA